MFDSAKFIFIVMLVSFVISLLIALAIMGEKKDPCFHLYYSSFSKYEQCKKDHDDSRERFMTVAILTLFFTSIIYFFKLKYDIEPVLEFGGIYNKSTKYNKTLLQYDKKEQICSPRESKHIYLEEFAHEQNMSLDDIYKALSNLKIMEFNMSEYKEATKCISSGKYRHDSAYEDFIWNLGLVLQYFIDFPQKIPFSEAVRLTQILRQTHIGRLEGKRWHLWLRYHRVYPYR
jgi:hypothetical protein